MMWLLLAIYSLTASVGKSDFNKDMSVEMPSHRENEKGDSLFNEKPL